jgi:hypothetical protein
MIEIVTCIDDDRQVLRRERLGQTGCQFRTTNPACQSHDPHPILPKMLIIVGLPE